LLENPGRCCLFERADNRRRTPVASRRLTVQQKKEIFRALVTIQDEGSMTVGDSFRHVVKEFEITEAQLRQIQDEGIEKEWPPLDEAVQTVR
jgi:hypothetical protein